MNVVGVPLSRGGWLLMMSIAAALVAAGLAVAILVGVNPAEWSKLSVRAPDALSRIGEVRASEDRGAAGFERLLVEAAVSRQVSLIALQGYLLTGAAGFKAEWQVAVARLQSAAEGLETDSGFWTDGQHLVQLVEMKRLVGQFVAEQQAVAEMIGTVTRFPGRQLFNEDVGPALAEAQAICADVLGAMLAGSTPEDAAAIDPVARLRGDLQAMRAALAIYAATDGNVAMPDPASPARLAAMIDTLHAIRMDVPAAIRPKLDRLAYLIGSSDENLQRISALRTSRRWDYADYAFRTRIMPLADRLRAISDVWEGGVKRE
ncbi:MAG: hypothetical protein Q7V31_02500 [Parvibaculum sp.]|uniref:hypothetical protein n=1 Tax=Parvibaculum sp. TaxID=2024848 RepID=UPI00271EA618|nr:hypothetical protein [Parvibaculum sp.]MDO8837771.1 hypothetical protein [Parvibaculum sp.]